MKTYVYHCRCCGKVFPSPTPGQISCPVCHKEYYDIVENNRPVYYSALELLRTTEADDFISRNPAAIKDA